MPVKKAAKAAKKAATPLIDPLFKAALLHAGLPLPVPEHRFHETRKWRWDYAWTKLEYTHEYSTFVIYLKVALEVQGGIWSRGRHATGAGIKGDMEKFSEGAALGWRLLLVEPKDLCSPATMDLIRRALDV